MGESLRRRQERRHDADWRSRSSSKRASTPCGSSHDWYAAGRATDRSRRGHRGGGARRSASTSRSSKSRSLAGKTRPDGGPSEGAARRARFCSLATARADRDDVPIASSKSDTLDLIAAEYYGDRQHAIFIVAENKLKDPRDVQPGQRLRIPVTREIMTAKRRHIRDTRRAIPRRQAARTNPRRVQRGSTSARHLADGHASFDPVPGHAHRAGDRILAQVAAAYLRRREARRPPRKLQLPRQDSLEKGESVLVPVLTVQTPRRSSAARCGSEGATRRAPHREDPPDGALPKARAAWRQATSPTSKRCFRGRLAASSSTCAAPSSLHSSSVQAHIAFDEPQRPSRRSSMCSSASRLIAEHVLGIAEGHRRCGTEAAVRAALAIHRGARGVRRHRTERGCPPESASPLPSPRLSIMRTDVSSPWRCSAPDGPPLPEEDRVGDHAWSRPAYLALGGKGESSIGTIADAGGSAPATLAALGRLRRSSSEARPRARARRHGRRPTSSRDPRRTRRSSGHRCRATRRPRVRERARRAAIKTLRGKRRRRVRRPQLAHRIELPGVTIATIPGAARASRLVAGGDGCGYRQPTSPQRSTS